MSFAVTLLYSFFLFGHIIMTALFKIFVIQNSNFSMNAVCNPIRSVSFSMLLKNSVYIHVYHITPHRLFSPG
jgi:hypothetical protein